MLMVVMIVQFREAAMALKVLMETAICSSFVPALVQ